jgi:hypothetical protein
LTEKEPKHGKAPKGEASGEKPSEKKVAAGEGKAPKEAKAPKEPKAAKEAKAAPDTTGADEPKAKKRKELREPSRLSERYRKEIVPALTKEFSYTNPMAVPRLRKIVVNMGMGEATQNIKVLDAAAAELGQITGQKPADRLFDNVARPAHVRFSRSPDEHCPAPRARLPGLAEQGVRRPRQLYHGNSRPVDFPGD